MVCPLFHVIELFINMWYNILVHSYCVHPQKGEIALLPIFLTIENEEERALAEELYLTYKNKMYGIAYAILHNKEDAEDTVMDSVYKIVNNISKFINANRNKTESLIVIIVRNTAINRYHYNQHRQHIPMDEHENMIPDDTHSPSDILIQQDQYEDLLKRFVPLIPYTVMCCC